MYSEQLKGEKEGPRREDMLADLYSCINDH